MDIQNEANIDPFVGIIGSIGRCQILLCCMIFLVKFPSAWYQLAIIYLAPVISFQCLETKGNYSENFDSKCYSNCSQYIYDQSVFKKTIISEWDLVCDKSWLKNLTQTVFMLGLLVGSTAFGFMADRWGRRKGFLAALVLMLTFGIATAFSPDYITFTVLRFIVGFASGGTMVTSFVMCMELVGSRYREVIGILYQVPFVLGNVSLPVFAYYFRSWNTFTLSLTVPSIIFLAFFVLLPESPRWLIANGKVDDATKIMTNAAKRNNISAINIREKVQKIADDLKSTEGMISKANLFDLFKDSTLRIKTLSSCIIWMFAGLYFFGVSQYISQTNGDIFISVAVAGAIQLPGDIFAIFTNKVFGRKKTTIATLVLSSFSMLAVGFLPLPYWLRLTISCLGVSFIGMTFSTIYIYSSELFPILVRNMGMGLSSTSSRIGSMIAPFVVGLSSVATWLPPLIFGIAPLIAAIFCCLLPETKGIALPNRIVAKEIIE